MRLGLIGDIHAEDERLEQALGVLAGADAILAVGDVCDGPGDLDRCCALLAERGVLAVRGNHDRWFLTNQMRSLPEATLVAAETTRAYLAALPATRVVESVLLCHGLGDNDMAGLRPHDEGYALEANTELAQVVGKHAIVVAGHTHHRMIRTVGGTVFVNPGTLYRAHEPGFMLLDTAARTVEIHLFGAARSTRHPLDDRFP